MRFISVLNAVVTGTPLFTIPARIENSQLVADAVSIDGTSFTLPIDVNSADLIVPICTSRSGGSDCYDPRNSGTFAYCAGTAQCYDRQSPPFACSRTVPASEWSIDTSIYTQHTLGLAGSMIGVNTFEFTATVSIIGNDTPVRTPLKGSITQGFKGVFGVGASRMSCRNETFATQQGAKYMQISIGNISFFADPPADPLWTEMYQLVPTNTSATLGKYAFNMFRPTVCGIDLLGNISSHWTTVVDTTEPCLVVPDFMFKSLATWRPGSDNKLYFSLRDGGNHESVFFELDHVCLKSLPVSASSTDFASTGIRPIVLGNQALRALGIIAFETISPFRMHFDNRATGHSAACTISKPVCIGQQVFYPQLNVCLNPDCDSYLMSELDPDTMQCVWKSYVNYVLTSIIAFIVIAEFYLYRLSVKTSSVAQAACERHLGVS